MAEIEQWVNLTRNNKWIGDGLTERARMGTRATIRVQMQNQARATLRVTLTADGDNATYSRPERRRRNAFSTRTYSRRRVTTNRRGVRHLTIPVTLAGGDKFTVTVEHRGNEVQSDDILTRRRLYFQIIKMAGVASVTAGDVQGMKDEFWNEAEKLYVQFLEFSPGRTIPARRNYNDEDPTVNAAVRTQARGQYDRSKRPYAFATLVCLRNGIPRDETQTIPVTIPAAGAAQTLAFSTAGVLFDHVDPAEEWYRVIAFQSQAGGAPVQIPKASCTRNGTSGVTVNTAGLPPGPGLLGYRLRVLGINGRGFSVPTDNYTLVASQDAITGNTVPAAEVMGVLIHEIGHKIGMVPGGRPTAADANRPASDRHYLDRQSTYYWARGHAGGHCHHGTALLAQFSPRPAGVAVTPDCVMFGDTGSNTSNFCEDCRTSIRKLDLRSRTNRGIRTQFQ